MGCVFCRAVWHEEQDEKKNHGQTTMMQQPQTADTTTLETGSEEIVDKNSILGNDFVVDEFAHNIESDNGEDETEPYDEDDATASEYEYNSESEYEYDEEGDSAFTGFIGETVVTVATAANDDDVETARRKQAAASWQEPSREAVAMSLRAEKETTGSKRRLAQDLYRIMNLKDHDAGYSIAPKSEDCMDQWIIKLFHFDKDSHLAQDMLVLGVEHIELEMTFPEQYPFEPPFVHVVRPRFKRNTGFVIKGALCMELLTKDGWNPVNDMESVIVSIRSILVVGKGRLQAAYDMPPKKYQARLKKAQKGRAQEDEEEDVDEESSQGTASSIKKRRISEKNVGSYTMEEAKKGYSFLSEYHEKKGWDSSGWWEKRG